MILLLLFSINTSQYLNIGKMYEQRGNKINAIRFYIKALPDTQAFSRIKKLAETQNRLKVYLAIAYLKTGKNKTGKKVLNKYLKSERGKQITGRKGCKYDRADMEAIYALLSSKEIKLAGKIAEEGCKKWGICGYRNVLWNIYTQVDTVKALNLLLKDLRKYETYRYMRDLGNIPKKFRKLIKEKIKRFKYDFLYGILIDYYLDESCPDSALIFLDKIPYKNEKASNVHKILRYGIENNNKKITLKILETEKDIKWDKNELSTINGVKKEQKIKELVNKGKIDEAINITAGNGEYLSRLLILKGEYINAKPYLKKISSNGDIKALDYLILINYKEGDEAKKLVMKELLDTVDIDIDKPFASLIYKMEYKSKTHLSETGDTLTTPYFLYLKWKKLTAENKRKEAKNILDTLLIKYPQSTPWFIINTLREKKK